MPYLFSFYSYVPDIGPDAFVECRGQAAKRSGEYPIEFADLIWNSVLNNIDYDEQEYGQAMSVSNTEDDGLDRSHGYAAAPAGSSAPEKAVGRSSWTRKDRGNAVRQEERKRPRVGSRYQENYTGGRLTVPSES